MYQIESSPESFKLYLTDNCQNISQPQIHLYINLEDDIDPISVILNDFLYNIKFKAQSDDGKHCIHLQITFYLVLYQV